MRLLNLELMLPRKCLYALTIIILTIPLIVNYSIDVPASPSQLKFYIYGSAFCPACKKAKEVLTSLFGKDSVVFRDTYNKTYMNEYFEICNLLDLKSFKIPLIIVYKDLTPIGAIIGVVPYPMEDAGSAWLEFISLIPEKGSIKVCEEYSCKVIESEAIINKLNSIVVKAVQPKNEIESNTQGKSLANVLFLIIAAAAADSINPCTFSVYTAMLLIALLVSRRRMFSVALPFILAIYISYTLIGYIIGIGLSELLKQEPLIRNNIKYIIAGLALFFGSFSIISGWGGEFKSPLPSRFKRLIEKLIEKSVNPCTAAIAGFLISVTLLPCTMGPYLPATMTLSTLSISEFIIGLLLYNAIFIAPLLMIAIVICFIETRVIKRWRTKKLATMEIISGLLLILIGIYALLFFNL